MMNDVKDKYQNASSDDGSNSGVMMIVVVMMVTVVTLITVMTVVMVGRIILMIAVV